MATVNHVLMITPRMIMQNVTKQKSSQTGFMNMTASSVDFDIPRQSLDLNPTELPWDVGEKEIGSTNVQLTNLHKGYDVIMSTWIRISKECRQHLVESMP